MSATQLERSVLEAKEREELFAIAAALGTKAAARSKKADLITQILRATGVEEGDSSSVPSEPQDKPKRTRARKAPDEAAGASDTSSTAATEAAPRSRQLRFSPVAESAETVDESTAAPAASATEPRRRASGPRSGVARSPRANGAEAPSEAPATSSSVSERTPSSPSASPPAAANGRRPGGVAPEATSESSTTPESPRRASGPSRSGVPRATGPTRSRAPEAAPSGSNGPTLGAGPARQEPTPNLNGGTTSDSRSGAEARSAAEGRSSPGPRSAPDTGGREGSAQRPEGESSSQNGQGEVWQGRSGPQARPASGQPQGGPSSTQPQGGLSQPGGYQDGASPGVGSAGGGMQGGGTQGATPQGPGGPQSRFDAEPGNRRNRRRRGRDRPERTEREPQSPQPVVENPAFSGEPVDVTGFLDLRDEGYGFLRTDGFLASQNDVYVSISQVRRFAMRKGDFVQGASRPPGSNEKYPALLRVDTVSGLSPDEARERPRFESLTPLFPDSKLRLELPGDPANLTARIVDLISPIGKGQRGLIVSPPKAGKTTVLKQIAHSIEANNPEVHLIVLLVDERPEEVTDMRRSVKGEVIASTFDRPSDEHTQVAELAIERAKRLVEVGRDVVIVLDGITRLARAYNLAAPATGRIMSGGIDTGALYPPKKFFGAARNVEEGGSLTILATALVETGSKMDEVIFEEFKGTGNMELRLDRRLAERRIYPAIDVNASSTRHEELLFDRTQLQQVWKLRRVLGALGSEGSHAAGLELLIDRIKMTRSNDEFLAEIAKNPAPNV